MRLHSIRRLCTLALGLLLPMTAAAQGTITGSVISATSGLALTGVAVRLDSAGREVLTDRSGRFVLPAVAAGPHLLRTRYLGYAPATMPVEVRSGATANVVI